MFPELDEKGFVKEVLDIFLVVEGGGGGGAFIRSFLVKGFSGVDPFNDISWEALQRD